MTLKQPAIQSSRPQPFRDPILWTPDEEAQVHTIDSLPARRKHVPTVTCIYGRRGQGKTLLATTMAEQRHERMKRARIPHKIYSNYWMEASHIARQTIVEELQGFPAGWTRCRTPRS